MVRRNAVAVLQSMTCDWVGACTAIDRLRDVQNANDARCGSRTSTLRNLISAPTGLRCNSLMHEAPMNRTGFATRISYSGFRCICRDGTAVFGLMPKMLPILRISPTHASIAPRTESPIFRM